MKKGFAVLMLGLVLAIGACNGSANQESGGADSSKVLPPPADNSNATNPSVADTAFAKKDSVADSTHHGK